MIQLTGLKALHEDMKRQHEFRALFPFAFNKRDFSCIFLTDMKPYLLYLTALGVTPVSIEFEVLDNYSVHDYISREKYKDLVRYLELKFDPNHKFKPSDFLNALNKKIPSKFTKQPSYIEVIQIGSKHKSIEEPEKKYFCGWRKNPPGTKVSPLNCQKTSLAFGSEMGTVSKKYNISSCWTSEKSKENLSQLNQMLSCK